MLYSERCDLAKKFEEWCKENNLKICSVNCITFLEIKGLLDIKKANKVIKDEKNNK